MARRVSRFTRGVRRATDWSASVSQAAYVSVPGVSVAILESFVPIVGGETLIRTRGFLSIASDQLSASEAPMGAFGICKVTE